jgi:hypothetical protein
LIRRLLAYPIADWKQQSRWTTQTGHRQRLGSPPR